MFICNALLDMVVDRTKMRNLSTTMSKKALTGSDTSLEQSLSSSSSTVATESLNMMDLVEVAKKKMKGDNILKEEKIAPKKPNITL